MLDINQPIFTYAGALMPERKPFNWASYVLAACVVLLIVANVM